MSRFELTEMTPPNTTAIGHRELHCSHHTNALLLDMAVAGIGNSILAYDLSIAPGIGIDLSMYDYLSLRLGQLYDTSSQANINLLAPPEFTVRLEDITGTIGEIDSKIVYGSMVNWLPSPIFKQITYRGVKRNATQIAMHTFSVDPASLFALTADQSIPVDLSNIVRLEFDFISNSSGEIWIDSVQMARK